MGRLHGPVVGGVVQVDQRVKFTKEVQSGLFYPWSNVLYADGDDGNDEHSGRGASDAKETIGAAVGVMTDNDILYLKAADYEESEELVLSLNDVQIIGVAPVPMQPHLDIWMAAAGGGFNPQITVSGRGNSFYNMCFRHGAEYTSAVGYATDLTCLKVSGRYNYFENVYFYSPIYGEQDIATTYKAVEVTGHNNYFKGCKFGADGTERDQVNYNLQVSGIGNIFEDCLFQMYSANTSPFFVKIQNTSDMKYTRFKNCTFYAHNSNFAAAPAYAFDVTQYGGTVGVILDNCNFVNVGQVTDANKDIWIWKSNYEGENNAETTKVGMIALREQGV